MLGRRFCEIGLKKLSGSKQIPKKLINKIKRLEKKVF